MAIEVGPGHPLICVIAGDCFCGCSHVTEGAMYFCEDVSCGPLDAYAHARGCSIKDCAGITVFVLDKEHGFCANRFVPLDPNDTSLVEDEEEEKLFDFVSR